MATPAATSQSSPMTKSYQNAPKARSLAAILAPANSVHPLARGGRNPGLP
jgi:hypothetical protein